MVDGVAQHYRACSVELIGAGVLVDRMNEVALVLWIEDIAVLHVLGRVHRQLHLILILNLHASHQHGLVTARQRVRGLGDVVHRLLLIINLGFLRVLVLELVEETDLVSLAVLLPEVVPHVVLVLALTLVIIILNVNLLDVGELGLLLLRDDLHRLHVAPFIILGELHHVLEVLDALLQNVGGTLGGVLALVDVALLFHRGALSIIILHVQLLGLRQVDVLLVRVRALLHLLLDSRLGVSLLVLSHVPRLRRILDL